MVIILRKFEEMKNLLNFDFNSNYNNDNSDSVNNSNNNSKIHEIYNILFLMNFILERGYNKDNKIIELINQKNFLEKIINEFLIYFNRK